MFVFKEISIKRKLLKNLLSIIILIFIFGCGADVIEDVPEDESESSVIVTHTEEQIPVIETAGKVENVTFNQILNNPFLFKDNDQFYLFYLTKNLNYIQPTKAMLPKVGNVDVIQIRGKSPDFGEITLSIVLKELVCAESIIKRVVEDGVVYSCQLKFYHVEETIGVPTHVYVWANLIELPKQSNL